MASTGYLSDIHLQHNIQEIELEEIPVEIPCETIETTISYANQPMHIAIPSSMRRNPDIILRPKQELIQVDTVSS